MAFDLGWGTALGWCLPAWLKGWTQHLEVEGMRCRAYIHPILPGLSEAADETLWGTLEVKATGHRGTEQGKFIQAYSSISHLIKACGDYEPCQPTTMKALRGRRQGLMNLVDTISAHMHQIKGLRVEVRVQEGGGSVGEAFGRGELILDRHPHQKQPQ